MLSAFDDCSTIRAMLSFESALAQAQCECGLIDPAAARRIADLCATMTVEPAALADEAAVAGTLAIPLVRRLRAALDEDTAAVVHLGATSQDVADTAMAMQMRAGTDLLLQLLAWIGDALALIAAKEAATPSMGRTLLQDAVPIGFGLRAAQWMTGIDAAAARLSSEGARACAVQFGGAAGTRDGLDGKGAAVSKRVASLLGLADPPAPWHARRDAIAGLAASLGIVIGALGKMARDVSLLAQNGIGEAREPLVDGRGGSSVMAHKRNPTSCQVTLSAATRAPGLVATILTAMPQELERGLGGWQSEWSVMADLFALAAGAAEVMLPVADELEIDQLAIATNLGMRTDGVGIGESAALVAALLAARVGGT